MSAAPAAALAERRNPRPAPVRSSDRASVASGDRGGGLLLIAHRGESRDAPENTLAAFGLAWQRGAGAIECDVHCTRDGALAVIHDAGTRRIGGPRRAVAKQTAAEIHALDAGAWKHRRWAGERVPLLAEVLAATPAHGRVFIELKEGPESVPPLAQALRAAKNLRTAQVVLISFNAAALEAVARALPRHETALIVDARHWTRRGGIARAVARARSLGCGALDLEAHRRLDRRVVEAVHAAGLRVYVWTVDRAAMGRRLAAAGVDGLATNRCAWLAERLAPGR